MKSIHLPYTFYPDPVGGTEIYVDTLAHSLTALGHEVVVVAPGEQDEAYDYRGLKVHRFAIRTPDDLRDFYGEGDATSAARVGAIFDDERPDVVHMHSLTNVVSTRVAREVKARGLPLVFSYHTATSSCMRGTLMRWGTKPCDGQIRTGVCIRCTLQGKGLWRPAAELVARSPSSLHRLAPRPLSTLLRMPELIPFAHDAFRHAMSLADRVTVFAEWTREVLVRNGVPQEKIVLTRHGISHRRRTDGLTRPVDPPNGPLRIACLARKEPMKGLDIVVEALQSAPGAPVELDLYSAKAVPPFEAYGERLAHLAARDPRVRLLPPVANQHVVDLLNGYHLLAVPSRCMEVSPLVLLEARAAGVPVLGSNLGGVAEAVRDEQDGLLLEPRAASWGAALRRFIDDPTLLPRLRSGIGPPRDFQAVTEQMEALYHDLLNSPLDSGHGAADA